ELLGFLEALHTDGLDAAAMVEVVAARRRLEAWCASRTAQATAQMSELPELALRDADDHRGILTPTNLTADELAPRLGMTVHSTMRFVATARALNGELWQTGEYLEAGEIDFGKANIIHRSLEKQALEITMMVEQV